MEWDYEKNGDLRPEMVSVGSADKVWWKCSKGHEWQATIDSRNRGNGCPICRKNKKRKENGGKNRARFFFRRDRTAQTRDCSATPKRAIYVIDVTKITVSIHCFQRFNRFMITITYTDIQNFILLFRFFCHLHRFFIIDSNRFFAENVFSCI